MKDVILWIFKQVSDFISLSMSWKIYGNFSFTHFILGAMFIFAIFKFLGFGAENYDNAIVGTSVRMANSENVNDKKNYTHYLASRRVRNAYGGYDTLTSKFRVNKKTGEVERL